MPGSTSAGSSWARPTSTSTSTPTLTPTNTPTLTPTATEYIIPPPELLFPASYEVVPNDDCLANVSLDWTPVFGADGYEVRIYEFSEGFELVPCFPRTTSATSLEVEHEVCALYCWQVRTLSETFGNSLFSSLSGYELSFYEDPYGSPFCTIPS